MDSSPPGSPIPGILRARILEWVATSFSNGHKWAIVPTMRKLLSLLNRIARDPNFVPIPEPESTKLNARVGRRRKAA